MYLHRTMLVPDSIVEIARALAESFGPASENMWTTPLSPTGELPATHWISTGFVGDDFAAVLPFSHFVDSAWVTEPYSTTAFMALTETNNVTPLPVEQITSIMSMVDVSDQEPFAAMARLGLTLVEEPING